MLTPTVRETLRAGHTRAERDASVIASYGIPRDPAPLTRDSQWAAIVEACCTDLPGRNTPIEIVAPIRAQRG